MRLRRGMEDGRFALDECILLCMSDICILVANNPVSDGKMGGSIRVEHRTG
jgi:hypothetical protein